MFHARIFKRDFIFISKSKFNCYNNILEIFSTIHTTSLFCKVVFLIHTIIDFSVHIMAKFNIFSEHHVNGSIFFCYLGKKQDKTSNMGLKPN